MELMYVTLPRNIQRFSKHSVLMLLEYPRVSQHLIAWNILAQNSSKQNFMGRVIMSSGKKKKKLTFFNLLTMISSIFLSPHENSKHTFLKARRVFCSHIIFLMLASESCLFSMHFKVFPWGFLVCACSESETWNVFLLLIFVSSCQSVLS